MRCTNCGHVNQADAKFCAQCGHALALTCNVCSSPVGPDDRFCANCGNPLTPADDSSGDLDRYLPPELLDKLRSARAGRAMQGERRTVTMLFADIQGSTAAAERLDPEDWADVINTCFEHLIAPVYRYEGTLARLQGDAVLAFFGAPIAHEDDPVRALRAGLEIVQAFERRRDEVAAKWGFPIDVRVGVNTGLVVVGEVGSDLRVEYTALGDAINVAARMEQTADAGTVRVSGQTRALAGDLFEFEDLGPVEVKGRSEPIPTFRVERFIGRSGGTRRPTTQVVGRTRELETFDDLRRRLSAPSGWIASVIAEAGVGKSALLGAVEQRAEAGSSLARTFDETGELTWMAAASRSYDSAVPFSTVRDLLTRWWAVEDAPEPFQRIVEAVQAVGVDDPDVPAFLAHVGGIEAPGDVQSFVDELETPIRHGKATDAVRTYLAAVFSQRPGYLVFEDLHWADGLSLALVDEVMELAEENPIGLVIAMRPYRAEPTWRIHEVAQRDHHHRYHVFELEPLAPQDGEELLDSLLGGDAVPADLRNRVLANSAGNPLFIEEMVRSMRDEGWDGVGALAVPSSLEGMLSARLDRLDEESRYVVQLASVLGSEFDRGMLAALIGEGSVDRSIRGLLQKGIFEETATGALGFRHALLRETAHESILRKTRRELHGRVAEHLINTTPSAVEAISLHLVEAGDVEAAFPYLVESGVRATRAMALADAIRSLELAVENTPVDATAADIVRAHDQLGTAYALVPDMPHAAAAYQRLYEYGEREERPEASVAALNRLAYATAAIDFNLDAAKGYLEQAREIAMATGDDVGLAEYHMNSCFVASMSGELSSAVQHDEQTVMLGTSSGVDAIRLSGMVRRTLNYTLLLDVPHAREAAEAALAEATRAANDESLAILRGFGTGFLSWMEGDVAAAMRELEGAQPVLDRFGTFYRTTNQERAAAARLAIGDFENALSRFAEALRVAELMGHSFVVAAASAGMALVYAIVGMPQPIPDLRARALEAIELPMGEFVVSTTWSALGWARLRSGDAAGAIEDFTHGMELSSITRYWELPNMLVGRAAARRQLGDLDAAEEDVDAAVAFVAEHGVAHADALIALERASIALDRQDPSAVDRAADAHRIALDQGRRLDAVEALLVRRRAETLAGDADAAERSRLAAVETIEVLAEETADQGLRDAFVAKWTALAAVAQA